MTIKTDTEPEYVDVTPRFNYSREVEVVKRFIEKLLTLADDNHIGSEVVAFVRNPVITDEIRKAMGLVMSNDIERQIKNGTFPLRKQLYTHQFQPESQPGDWPIGKPEPHCVEPDCYALENTPIHLLA